MRRFRRDPAWSLLTSGIIACSLILTVQILGHFDSNIPLKYSRTHRLRHVICTEWGCDMGDKQQRYRIKDLDSQEIDHVNGSLL